MTVLADLTAHIRHLEERSRLVDVLQQQLAAANRATQEARRQLATAEALYKRATYTSDAKDYAIVELLATGAPMVQIAQEVGLTENGLAARLRRIYRAHGVNTHARLVSAYLRAGLLDIDDVPGEWVGKDPTDQQKRILQGIADYGTNKEIGAALGISPNTVAMQLQKMRYHAGIGLKAQLLVRAYKKGWVE